ncbi:CpsD/CapB family tyrosine-protein kinase [Sphingobium sp. Z007]|uniref:CpsD/CapB family tyrosine-protein kinase n=2 Tax=Sphingobium sp. Z007 TaxID=627495 RepID=UPI001124F676|nr:CpsD/CapB family tyrosine-protein kinase [Sphingobium sp. Z007]
MLGYHRADPATVWNGGIGFSRCLGCGVELVQRPGAGWTPVPRGYAVIWRPAADRPALAGHPPVGTRAFPLARLADGARRIGAAAGRTLDRFHAPTAPASRSYRYLAQRIGSARTIVLSALCDADAANDTLLLLTAMIQAERGGRVLLIDATLGGDGVSVPLGASGQPGLSEVRADDPWSAVEVMRMLPRPDMILLGAGQRPAAGRPDHIAGMLSFLADRFDHILIQQRAIMADSRNIALATRADLIWALAEEGRSPMADLHAAHEAFRANGIADVGLILTMPVHGG